MTYTPNKDKMLQAVLLNERLMKVGNYTPSEIGSIYSALDSDNCVINTVAQIIQGAENGASERELWKQIFDYLKRNI